MIVIACPGQGSQTPGFLEPWLVDDSDRRFVEDASEASGVDLVLHGTRSDADTIRDTEIAQPLIVAASLVALRALLGRVDAGRIDGFAGHSVGEIAAAAGAGVLTDLDAMSLVGERSRAMALAASAVSTGMSAVLGGNPDQVADHARSLGLHPVNYNGGGQLVVAGELDALALLSQEPLERTRVVPLQVAGAFHTPFMAPAQEALATVAGSYATSDPTTRLWTNADGSEVASGDRFVELIVHQVTSPVRWDLCMDAFVAAGVTGLIELAPGGALTGLARRAMKGVPTVAIRTPDDLEAAHALLEQNA